MIKLLTDEEHVMARLLVTGGAGFIASNLADKLSEDKDNFVVSVDNLLTGKKHHNYGAPNT